jgi:hypothetical protein
MGAMNQANAYPKISNGFGKYIGLHFQEFFNDHLVFIIHFGDPLKLVEKFFIRNTSLGFVIYGAIH